MTLWLRFTHADEAGFGTLEHGLVQVHRGDMFSGSSPTGRELPLSELTWAIPCVPSKFIGLYNNYRAFAKEQKQPLPKEPLYFIKGANSYLAHGRSVRAPRQYSGRVVFEGELGIVVGQRAYDLDPAQAARCIFGYTCVNDITAVDIFARDPEFVQWTRAKSFDGFGPFGPVIATDLDAMALTVRTVVNGRERQNYPTADMIFSPAEIVSHLSRELSLEPGDVIACGTSAGVGSLEPGMTVDVNIEGIGCLTNRFEAPPGPKAGAGEDLSS